MPMWSVRRLGGSSKGGSASLLSPPVYSPNEDRPQPKASSGSEKGTVIVSKKSSVYSTPFKALSRSFSHKGDKIADHDKQSSSNHPGSSSTDNNLTKKSRAVRSNTFTPASPKYEEKVTRAERDINGKSSSKDALSVNGKRRWQFGKATKKEARQAREARTVLHLITGMTSPGLPSAQFTTVSASKSPPSVHDRTPAEVSNKEIKRLKSSLADPKEASRIIEELKKISLDGNGRIASTPEEQVKLDTRAACLECLDAEVLDIHANHSKSPFADENAEEKVGQPASSVDSKAPTCVTAPNGVALFTGKFRVLSSIASDGTPTPGKILGQVASTSGTFTALAGVAGRLVQASGSHAGLVTPPDDRLSVLVYWWGYELVLPPPTLTYLNSVHSVAGTAFTFLQALAVTGGVPEIAPFVRYLSYYIDMEWKAISTQNKGKGVVLAATWVVPVAVIPRPYDLS